MNNRNKTSSYPLGGKNAKKEFFSPGIYKSSKVQGLRDEEKVSLERLAVKMCWSQSQGKQVVAGLVVYLEGQSNVLKHSRKIIGGDRLMKVRVPA